MQNAFRRDQRCDERSLAGDGIPIKWIQTAKKVWREMARPERFELPTP
jgi:hypothetical protein